MSALSIKMGALLLVASGLAACASTPVVAPSQIVTVTHVRYVPLPAADLLSCVYPAGTLTTNQALLMAEQAAVRSLQVCNRQLDDLRTLDAKVQHP